MGAVIGEPVSRLLIPCSAVKYREIMALGLVRAIIPLSFASIFNALPSNSLRIETGNFADGTANST